LLAVMEGSAPPDLSAASLKGVRFGVLTSVAQDDLRAEPDASFQAAVTKLEAAGATMEEFEVPGVDEALGFGGKLYTAEAYGLWRDVIEATPEKMFDEILARFRLGKDVSGPDYVALWARLTAIRAAYDAAAAKFDAVLVPTAPILPPNMERLATDSDYYVTENLLALRNTRIGNLMGLCGLTVPTGTPSCGLQLMGAPGQDRRILRLGAAAAKVLLE